MNAITVKKSSTNLPFVTISLALASLLISCTSLKQTLQYDRLAIGSGKLWLLITGHLSHWSPDNLLWDLLVFVVLGVLVERRSRQGFILCLGISAILISTMLWFGQQGMDFYRGLSGLDSALFGLTALWMTRERIGAGDYRGAAVILVAAVLFFVKIVYESFALQAVFSSSAGLFVPVPLAHLTGVLAGIGVALFIPGIEGRVTGRP